MPSKLEAKKKFIEIMAVHFAVFAGHLVYAIVVVALIFRNKNSLINLKNP